MEGRRTKALGGWLAAIATSGWRKATLEGAAEAAGMAPQDILAAIGDRFDALAALQDKVAEAAALGAAAGQSVRERLFDGIMQGFDQLQANRAAVQAVRGSRDPGVAALVVGRAGLHLRRLAFAAGIDVRGLRGHLRMAAFAALALKAFQAWIRDDSPDMAGTMAELDRLLGRAERAELEGLSPDLLGLPGLTGLFDRLRPALRHGRGDQVPPPSPGPSGE